ncbi:MAG: AsmA family protein [Alphaproteobacteria bacterium]|nr:AsmA family protein [Alphaproteobacteria bacterium]
MNRNQRYGLIAGGIALIFAVVFFLVPPLLPTASLKGEIEHRVSAATGRAFRIDGPLTYSFFPTVSLTARDVHLANMPGGHERDMLCAASMHIAVRLFPLLAGRIEATDITFDSPRIALEVARDGKANWELVETHTAQSGLRVPASLTFAGVTIRDATASYDNARLSTYYMITALDSDVAITRLAQPVSAAGSFVYNRRKLDYTATLATPTTLLAGKATKVDVTANADFVHAGFLGFISADGTAKGQGSLRTPSLKDLAAWLGHPVSAGRGLGELTALAQIAAKDQRVVFTQIESKLDGMRIGGTLSADIRAKVPTVNGTLDVDQLNLNTYLDLGGGPAKRTFMAPPSHASGPPSGGWSKAPIKLDLIKLLNGHLRINAGGLTVRNMHLWKTVLSVSLQDGLMETHLDPMALYGGSGKAFIVADARGTTPAFKNQLTFTNVAMKPFLTDTIGVDRLDGTGSITLDVTSTGTSPDALMHNLAGKGAVVIGHGRVRGVDMGKVARTVQTILSAGATGQSAATEFDRFSGSFAIQHGILWNGDLKLSSPYLNMTGAGHLDLGAQTINYRIEPKLAAGGRLHLLDVGVPFAITGTWAHVTYKPDLTGAVTGLIGGVLERGTAPLTGLLNGLIGGANGGNGQKPATAPPPRRKSKGVGDTLKGIFGLH